VTVTEPAGAVEGPARPAEPHTVVGDFGAEPTGELEEELLLDELVEVDDVVELVDVVLVDDVLLDVVVEVGGVVGDVLVAVGEGPVHGPHIRSTVVAFSRLVVSVFDWQANGWAEPGATEAALSASAAGGVAATETAPPTLAADGLSCQVRAELLVRPVATATATCEARAFVTLRAAVVPAGAVAVPGPADPWVSRTAPLAPGVTYGEVNPATAAAELTGWALSVSVKAIVSIETAPAGLRVAVGSGSPALATCHQVVSRAEAPLAVE
jgi:hypothetical protein